MKILITGATGFVGTHLCEYLLSQGHEIHGTYIYPQEVERFPEHLRGTIALHTCDLSEMEQVKQMLCDTTYDRVYNLAAISSVHQSWSKGQELVLKVNLYGWLNLLEGLRSSSPNARILMVSSGEVYGIVPPDKQPITESEPLRPINPYADSKAAQEMFSYQYIHRYQSQIVIVRPFNHTGPRQSPDFVCPDFARQIAEIEAGRREPVMSVGNLDARRDFSDVRDIVRAYALALECCQIGTPINIASGVAYSIQHILDTLLSFSRIPIEVRRDSTRMRPSDTALMLGDASQLRKHTGWKPEIPFEETLANVLEYWRAQVGGKS